MLLTVKGLIQKNLYVRNPLQWAKSLRDKAHPG
jgi:hypothetical protein